MYRNLHVKHMFLFLFTVLVLFFKTCLLHSIDEKFWKLLSEFVDTFEIYSWRKKKRKN
jgi:hypothetical protein